MTKILIDEATVKLALETLEKHGEAPKDWACKECVPFSDILKDGFQCKYHKAIAALKALQEAPAQRTWVSLSEEDREQHRNDWHSNIHDKEFRAIEAKLRSKNENSN